MVISAIGSSAKSCQGVRLRPRSPRQASSGLPWAPRKALLSQAATTAANSALVGGLPEVSRQPCISATMPLFGLASASVHAASPNNTQNAMTGMLRLSPLVVIDSKGDYAAGTNSSPGCLLSPVKDRVQLRIAAPRRSCVPRLLEVLGAASD